MKKIIYLILAGSIMAFAFVGTNDSIQYPKAKKMDVVDEYFGIKISDPYRWLEDDNSAETAEWVKAENKITNAYLDQIPFRSKIKERLTKIWNYEKYTAPFKKGKYYFFYKNNGIQNQSVLYIQEGLNGTPKVLIDPNTLSADGTTSLAGISISKNAKYMAYNIAKAGSDWNEIYVMDLETMKPTSDTIRWVKFSQAAWKGNGFYYSRYPAPTDGKVYSNKNENNRAYYHTIGKPQSQDELVYEDPKNPHRSYSIGLTEDEKYMMLWGTESTSGNSFAFKSADKKGPWIEVDTKYESDYTVVDNDGTGLLVLTNRNAPMNKLVLIDEKNPGESNWKTVVAESKNLLESVSMFGDKMALKYLQNVSSKIIICSLEGKNEKEIELPALGIVGSFNCDKGDTLAFYSFTNYVTPTSIYTYGLTSGKSKMHIKPKVDFNSELYETKQVFYKSKDGTSIPMFITHRKGIAMDGNNPCFLYGYGGFNISVTPSFQVTIATLLENGFVYAAPALRGGGEYGEEWHKAGTLCNKQNVFDDFIAAAEYLFKNNYTNSSRLAIHGRSNGGLLVGAVMTQRPDLAKVALPGVGVLDMLRYHKFTIGYFWATDYGRSDSSAHFKCLFKYSPLHNVAPISHPATMITTADHDDRVVPAHSFKFAATLQEKQVGNNPILIRIDVKAGHGAGKPTAKQIDEWTDVWSFVFKNLGVNPFYK